MFTQTDLTHLMTRSPSAAVSIFMQTHPKGKEIRQDPIRLKNLLADARSKLAAAGLTDTDIDPMLSPATAFLEDREFWQHQSTGLALFIDEGQTHDYRVPLNLDEGVVVGDRFHLRPLLPLLESDGQFSVLTVTAEKATLFNASRFQMTEDATAELPAREPIESDYENPLQASPPARPNVGSANIPNAQVYGDSPPDFKKTRLLEFVADVAKAAEHILTARPQPFVLVADAEISGHFQQSRDLGPLLAGTVDTNPNALDSHELHRLAYAKVRERLDRGRMKSLSDAAALLGRGDATATNSLADIVRASHQGRIRSLLLRDGAPIWGRYDRETDKVEMELTPGNVSEDLLNVAATETLQHGGDVHVMSVDDLPADTEAVAILRY
ncbi:hypothetical protein IWX64_003190 [Arthrobacter sp. CAN_A212]|uniref:baeRF3 domain-containing protein n=1 Tax=Arthrobacter sp. CAN_A212 TaxID=2787719 RepID=UPI0018CA8A69